MVISPILRLAAKIASFILYGATLCAAYSGYVNPEITTLPAALTLGLPFLAITTAVVGVSWLIGRQFIVGSAAVLTLLLGIGPIMSAVPLSFGEKAMPGETTFRMVSFNCLHLYDMRKPDNPYSRPLRYLLSSDADFICLVELYDFHVQEERVTYPGHTPGYINHYKAQLDSLLAKYPYRAGSGNSDIKILSRYPVEELRLPLTGARYPECYDVFRLRIKGKELTVAAVHLPSFNLSDSERDVIHDFSNTSTAKEGMRELKGSIREKFDKAFRERALASKELTEALRFVKDPVVVCGDFNDVPASWTYRTFTKAGFRDAYTATCFGPIHTYNDHLMLFHLDQILYRGNLRPLKVKCPRLDSSDHYPLEAEFAFINPDNDDN